ncbi:glycosyltransferase [Pseudomonas sp. TH31]|uniref:glycosyltransferase n=1 Tax=Pseudomonas sp. TH31 TaxID=2796396 RepID=UPI00313CA8FA
MATSSAPPVFELDGTLQRPDLPLDTGVLHVTVLMCSYNGNGERFLTEQLNSFERQTHHNWTLVVSDDDSQDGTLKLVQAYSRSWGADRLKVVLGPQRDFVTNFPSLTVRTDIQADFYGWSDQDDIWCENNLHTALAWLRTIPKHIPALYCGRTKLIYESGITVGYSPRFCPLPYSSNALVQNIGGDNTMLFNQAARDLLQEAGDNLIAPSHDWWVYQLISGAGGAIHYDPQPRVPYRQHDGNLVGSNSNWSARFQRLRTVFKGRFYHWRLNDIMTTRPTLSAKDLSVPLFLDAERFS